jgi:hypothetical protein
MLILLYNIYIPSFLCCVCILLLLTFGKGGCLRPTSLVNSRSTPFGSGDEMDNKLKQNSSSIHHSNKEAKEKAIIAASVVTLQTV